MPEVVHDQVPGGVELFDHVFRLYVRENVHCKVCKTDRDVYEGEHSFCIVPAFALAMLAETTVGGGSPASLGTLLRVSPSLPLPRLTPQLASVAPQRCCCLRCVLPSAVGGCAYISAHWAPAPFPSCKEVMHSDPKGYVACCCSGSMIPVGQVLRGPVGLASWSSLLATCRTWWRRQRLSAARAGARSPCPPNTSLIVFRPRCSPCPCLGRTARMAATAASTTRSLSSQEVHLIFKHELACAHCTLPSMRKTLGTAWRHEGQYGADQASVYNHLAILNYRCCLAAWDDSLRSICHCHVAWGMVSAQVLAHQAMSPNGCSRVMRACLVQEVDIGHYYKGQGSKCYQLRSLLCYYGSHYHSFVRPGDDGTWCRADDLVARVVGDWSQVMDSCKRGKLQPSMLFYEPRPGEVPPSMDGSVLSASVWSSAAQCGLKLKVLNQM